MAHILGKDTACLPYRILPACKQVRLDSIWQSRRGLASGRRIKGTAKMPRSSCQAVPFPSGLLSGSALPLSAHSILYLQVPPLLQCILRFPVSSGSYSSSSKSESVPELSVLTLLCFRQPLTFLMIFPSAPCSVPAVLFPSCVPFQAGQGHHLEYFHDHPFPSAQDLRKRLFSAHVRDS